MNRHLKLIALAVVTLALVGCTPTPSNNNNQNNGGNTTGTSPTPSTDGATTGGTTGGQTDGGSQVDKTINLNMNNYSFSTKTIEVEAGTTVAINLTSTNGLHDFVIDELNVGSRTLGNNQSQTIQIEIPANAAGDEYEFYCSIGNHRAMGMKGTLKVK